MIAHFTRMAAKALLRFKMHTVISLLSLVVGFICFVSALILSNYSESFDRGFPNSDRIYNIMIRAVGDSPLPDRFPIVNEPTARYLRAAFPEIPNIARASTGFPQTVEVDDRSMPLDTKYVEQRFFDIFPVETIYGLAQGEELPPNSVMLTERGARKLFGRTDVVGERLLIENRFDVSVAGVTKTLDFPSHLESPIAFFRTEMFVPMALQDQWVRVVLGQRAERDHELPELELRLVHAEVPHAVVVGEVHLARPASHSRLEVRGKSEGHELFVVPVD